MRFIKIILNSPFYLIGKLHRISQTNKTYRKYYAYYAFPMLVSLLVTFSILRISAKFLPNFEFNYDGVHIHHFIPGIFIILIVGYLALCTISSWKSRYILALAYGNGAAFILDEFYVWLRLDGSPLTHAKYNAVVIGAALLLIILLLPSGVHALHRLFNKNVKSNEPQINSNEVIGDRNSPKFIP